ncbi:DUF4169 family protein [Thalassospira sp. MA62]|nr:DUF4169 family protein [Thalassospira sp. MA62]
MGDLINLRQVRKQKKRDAKAQKADQNRATHGRARHERDLSDAQKAKAQKDHDGHMRNPTPSDDAAASHDVPDGPSAPDQSDKIKSRENNVVSMFGDPTPSDR